MDDPVRLLEEKISFLDKTMSDLDEVVREVSDRLDLLRREVADMREALVEHLEMEEREAAF